MKDIHDNVQEFLSTSQSASIYMWSGERLRDIGIDNDIPEEVGLVVNLSFENIEIEIDEDKIIWGEN